MLNSLGDTIVAIWDLAETSEKLPSKTESLDYKNERQESVIGSDERERVAKQNILPGGKYRCKHSLVIDNFYNVTATG